MFPPLTTSTRALFPAESVASRPATVTAGALSPTCTDTGAANAFPKLCLFSWSTVGVEPHNKFPQTYRHRTSPSWWGSSGSLRGETRRWPSKYVYLQTRWARTGGGLLLVPEPTVPPSCLVHGRRRRRRRGVNRRQSPPPRTTHLTAASLRSRNPAQTWERSLVSPPVKPVQTASLPRTPPTTAGLPLLVETVPIFCCSLTDSAAFCRLINEGSAQNGVPAFF